MCKKKLRLNKWAEKIGVEPQTAYRWRNLGLIKADTAIQGVYEIPEDTPRPKTVLGRPKGVKQ
jgi:predicted site-specific integrase-resolvase